MPPPSTTTTADADRARHRRHRARDHEVKPFHEMGQRYATELRPGNVNVYGTIGRAHVNGALLKLMLGTAARAGRGRVRQPDVQPQPADGEPVAPRQRTTVTVMGVKLDEWSYDMPEDDFVMEKVGFQALWMKVEDARRRNRHRERVAWRVH